MRISRRSALAVGVFVLLGAFVLLGRWYETTRAAPGQSTDSVAPRSVAASVTTGGDRGPGSLREALFVANAAGDKANIVIRVKKIAIETALPPLANPRGVTISAQEPGAEIDAQALQGGPVFDVVGANTAVEGLVIRNCTGAAILLRADRFRLTSATIEACDVGVDVAENASNISLERNRFNKNRIGVRFAASSRNATVVKNEFSAHADAGVWAVRGEPDLRSGTISVRDNKFSNDRMGILAGNVSLLVEHNNLIDAREAAVHVIGEGVVVRGNRINRGAAMGIVVENARAAIVENNELDHVTAYAIMVRGSANALARANRMHNCGYGMAFVLGDTSSPSTAVENSIIGPKYHGIDVVGDSPILRRNRVLQAQGLPLHVENFQPPGGQLVRAKPFLDGNNFTDDTAPAAAGDTAGLQATVTP